MQIPMNGNLKGPGGRMFFSFFFNFGRTKLRIMMITMTTKNGKNIIIIFFGNIKILYRKVTWCLVLKFTVDSFIYIY